MAKDMFRYYFSAKHRKGLVTRAMHEEISFYFIFLDLVLWREVLLFFSSNVVFHIQVFHFYKGKRLLLDHLFCVSPVRFFWQF